MFLKNLFYLQALWDFKKAEYDKPLESIPSVNGTPTYLSKYLYNQRWSLSFAGMPWQKVTTCKGRWWDDAGVGNQSLKETWLD